MRRPSAAIWVGGLLVATGAATWLVVMLVYPQGGRNVTEALVMGVLGVYAPAIGALAVVGGLVDRYRSPR